MYSLICGIIRWQVVSDDTSGAVSEFTTFHIYLSLAHEHWLEHDCSERFESY